MLEDPHIVAHRERNRERLEAYLEIVLQRDVALQDWDGHGRLPVFLTRLYQFFQSRIGQTPLLFMFAEETGEHTPAAIAKHLDLVRPEFDGIVVYSAERIAAGFRARLVAGGVAFAVPGNQLFVPELATDLREYFRGPKPERADKLSPSAQLVLFFHVLEGGQRRQWSPTELAAPLGYSIMTMSRALEELAVFGLARIERRGRRKLLWFLAEGRLLIEDSRTLLIRPERRQDCVRWLKHLPDLPLAGEHALACFSDLNPPSAPPVYAVTQEQRRGLLVDGWAELEEADYSADGSLATWKYDPRVLARNQIVDPLSLYAQFRGDADERLSMAADQLLEQTTW